MAEPASLTLAARLDNLAAFSAAVVAAARLHGLEESRLGAIELALEEALVNIFSHAFPEGDGEVTVTCMADENSRFVIRIEDDGPPFDLLAREAPDVTASLDERTPGGLGIHLIRQVMDTVTYARQHGRNVLTLIP